MLSSKNFFVFVCKGFVERSLVKISKVGDFGLSGFHGRLWCLLRICCSCRMANELCTTASIFGQKIDDFLESNRWKLKLFLLGLD